MITLAYPHILQLYSSRPWRVQLLRRAGFIARQQVHDTPLRGIIMMQRRDSSSVPAVLKQRPTAPSNRWLSCTCAPLLCNAEVRLLIIGDAMLGEEDPAQEPFASKLAEKLAASCPCQDGLIKLILRGNVDRHLGYDRCSLEWLAPQHFSIFPCSSESFSGLYCKVRFTEQKNRRNNS